MIVFCTIVTLIMSIAMFFVSKEKKIALIFIVNMLFSLLEISFIPVLKNAFSIIIVAFILSEFKYLNVYVGQIKSNLNLRYIFFILILMTALDIIFSPHIHETFLKSIQYVYLYLFQKYFLVFLAIVAFSNEKSMLTLVRYSMLGMIVLTLFGIINLIQGRAAFVTEMMSNHAHTNFVTADAGDHYMGSSRFRVQAMFQNSFDYGYICSVCLILYIYARKYISKFQFITMVICCVFGILMCNCRTVMLCAFSGIGIYVLFALNVRKIIGLAILAAVTLAIMYSFVPIVANTIDSIFTVFTDTEGKNSGGSNIMMRTIQLAATLSYIEDKPWFGNGVYFFNIDLGWDSDDRSLVVDKDLYGLEGVYLNYLLEHGWIGYILYLIVWLIILKLLIQNKWSNKELFSCGIAIWCIYILFANMTGELGSLKPTLILLGGILGALGYNRKRENKNHGRFNNNC